MQGITTFFMFNDQAEEAAKLYTSVFKNSKILDITRAGENGPAVSVDFQLDGTRYMAYNGGPRFSFSEGISLFVRCDTQDEVDELWEKLSEGGEKQQCGWLKDRFGVSWQIIPELLMELMSDPDPEKSKRVVDAMLQMTKIEIVDLENAQRGE